MDRKVIDTIISDIYAAAAGRRDWRMPLSALAERLDLWAVQVAGLDKHSGTLLFSFEGGPHPPEAILSYIREYHQLNPRIKAFLDLNTSAWFHDQDHFDEKFIAQDPFFQDYLIPYGGGFGSFIKVIENDDLIVVLGVARGTGKPYLNADEIEILTHVKFHMGQAMENYLHLRNVYAEMEVGKRLLNEFRYPMVLVDESRSIRFRNHAAEKVLAQTDYIYDSNGNLRCRNIDDNNDLLLAIRSLELQSTTGNSNSACNRTFVRIRKADGGHPVAVFVIAIRPEAVMAAFGCSPLALLIFHDPETEQQLDPFIVAETFGLTPAESRIAVNLVKGLSVKEMANHIGVSPTTIKSQLQSIYSKTGTNRQAELCVLLTSTLVLTTGSFKL